MEFPLSRAEASVLEILPEAGSTNDELVRRATGADSDGWPDFSVVATANQTRGRGRLGRSWVSPAGKSLAISVLLRPRTPDGDALPMDSLGWFPLLAGLAMTRSVRSVVPAGADLKWPNDVLVNDRKVCGILSELLPDVSGIVIGAGLNLTLEADELPVQTATSLMLAGANDTDADNLLSSYLRELDALYRPFLAARGDAAASGLQQAVSDACGTIGRSVQVELPSGDRLTGTATGIDTDGRLLVDANARISAVAAGDVTHLRY
ncbi:biotin--[acetyl-CoA-carboxylase] ligase [Diaminobutyricibacter sp. McL0608]|uniref:biotin--[acetyl-CoA-carboxylase] ligase n=1 Tax=Leifsonia sp. McL0608 TaxID=3143537 RepID=UPI0031F2F478